ncbi:Polycystic kidney disease protein 1-like 3 [Aphelenchoides avenae]|nr:Polycystic kidney disease protein 1-like 3 [Aphelenchus avenae]
MNSYVTSTSGIVYSASDGKTVTTHNGELYVMSNSSYVPYNVTEEYRGVEDELKNDLYADQDSIISVGHTDPNALVDNEVTVVYVSSPTKGLHHGYEPAILSNASMPNSMPMPTYTTMAPTNFATFHPTSMAEASTSGMYSMPVSMPHSYAEMNHVDEVVEDMHHSVMHGMEAEREDFHRDASSSLKSEELEHHTGAAGGRRAREAFRKRQRRESETAEQAARRRAKNLEAKRRRMARESEEEKAARRNRDAEAKRMRRQRETPEQRERRLKRDSERMRRARRLKKYGAKTEVIEEAAEAFEEPTASSSTPMQREFKPTIVARMAKRVRKSARQGIPLRRPCSARPEAPTHHPTAPPQSFAPAHCQDLPVSYATAPISVPAPTTSCYPMVAQPQPTVITLPLPVGTGNTGPLMIHLTLPENIRPEQIQFSAQTGVGSQPQQIIIQSGTTQPPLAITVSQQPSTSSIQAPHRVDTREPSVEYVPSPEKGHSQGSVGTSSWMPPRYGTVPEDPVHQRRQANAERSRKRRAAETPEQRAERNRRTAERMREKRAEIKHTSGMKEKAELTADRFEEIFQSVLRSHPSRYVKSEPISALEEEGYSERAGRSEQDHRQAESHYEPQDMS